MKEYLTVLEASFGEYDEKRSRFISGIYPCTAESEATEILSTVKSNNFGANHNVYAYKLKDGTVRFSDDGEPHGTAGKPVLEVLEGSGLCDVLFVVTRYFGGVLLGTGGLVRAYTAAAKDALDNSDVYKICECVKYDIICDYTDHGKLMNVLSTNNVTVNNTEFSEKVKLSVTVLLKDANTMQEDICESFSARIKTINEEICALPKKMR